VTSKRKCTWIENLRRDEERKVILSHLEVITLNTVVREKQEDKLGFNSADKELVAMGFKGRTQLLWLGERKTQRRKGRAHLKGRRSNKGHGSNFVKPGKEGNFL